MTMPVLDELKTMHVAFQGKEVAVRAEAPEVRAGIEKMFSAMVAPPAAPAVGQLEVRRNGGPYFVTGNTEVGIEDGSLPDVLRCIRFSVIQMLIAAWPELLWLHAGAAASGQRAMLLAGPRGYGKSTLVTGLCARGWTYLSDDIVPIDPRTHHALPFPITPAKRVFPGRQMPGEWLREPTKVDVSLDPATFARQAIPIGAIVFPTYAVGVPPRLSPCRPAEAALDLLQQCWNFRALGTAAVRCLCDLVRRLPAFRLSYSDGDTAADVLMRSNLFG
jgi:hypothetical protein